MKLRSFLFIFLIILVFLTVPLFAESTMGTPEGEGEGWIEGGEGQPYVKIEPPDVIKCPNGLIVDWKNNVAVAKGSAYLTGIIWLYNRKNTERAAIRNGIRNLNELIGEVPIGDSKILEDLIKSDKNLQKTIKEQIKEGAKVIYKRFYPNKRLLEVTLAVKLNFLTPEATSTQESNSSY